MHALRSLICVTALLAVSACGDDDASPATLQTTTTSVTTSSSSSASTSTGGPSTTPTASTTNTTPTTAPSTSTTAPTASDLVAVWPAADVVLSTPEEAAAGFVRAAFGFEPVLGEFAQGDLRSGEIEVLPPLEASGGAPRSVLFLRRLGPNDGWFVIGAGSDADSITTPATGDVVPAGPLVVEGMGTGFEATVVVRAFVAGDAATEFDRQVVMAGNFGETAPYSTTLDLSGARPGDVVVLLVSGGVGLETDTGDFSAIPVVIAGP